MYVASDDDTRDFEAIVLPHLDEAYSLARWLMRNASESEDVVQEAMVRALTYFKSYKGRNARAWLLQIVRNTAYAALRARQDTVGIPSEDADREPTDLVEKLSCNPHSIAPVELPADPEALLQRTQNHEQLEVLLGELPHELRECILLYEISGCSYREIAEITGTPVGTVMSRLWRARRKLASLAAERLLSRREQP